MSDDEYRLFRRFDFYLDKDAVGLFRDDVLVPMLILPFVASCPIKYRLRVVQPNVILSTGLNEVGVGFRTRAQSGVDLPNPAFLRAHAAFAKVLNFCDATQYLESDAERIGPFRENAETDVALLLVSKLLLTADTQG